MHYLVMFQTEVKGSKKKKRSLCVSLSNLKITSQFDTNCS